MARSSSNLFTHHNKVKVLRGGAEYFKCLEEVIDSATYSLHLQTYIYDGDETGKRIADALIRAANRKVLVYVLLDGYASQDLSKKFITRLKEAGIHFSFFEPLLRSRHFYFGRRLHHKIVVADAHRCITSGANISNRYNDIGTIHAWLDWAIYAEGEVARQLSKVSIQVWNRSVLRKKCMVRPGHYVEKLPDEECLVRVRRNDWVYKKTEITRTYRELFRSAHDHVTVMTGYFWPAWKLLRHMAAASRRGVKIKLILTAKADVPFSKYTERYLYPWLFRNKIEVYEYQDNILHGKIAVCDNEWLTGGSYNVNQLSALASVELNLDVKDSLTATEVNGRLEKIIKENCRRITTSEFAAESNLLTRFFYYLSYHLVRVIFFLFTFYFVQKRANG